MPPIVKADTKNSVILGNTLQVVFFVFYMRHSYSIGGYEEGGSKRILEALCIYVYAFKNCIISNMKD